MSELINRETGKPELIDAADMPAALASNKYVTPDAIAVHRGGADTYASPDQYSQDKGFVQTIDPAKAALAQGRKIREDRSTGVLATGKAALGSAIDSGTFGAFDPFQEEQEFNRGASTFGALAGAFAPALLGDEAGLVSAFRDPLEAERAASAMSSKFLLGGEIGGEAGSAAKAAEKGLAKAGEHLAAGADAAAVPEDLAAMADKRDLKGLRGARESEVSRLEAEHTTARDAELARIENEERVPGRQKLIQDLDTHVDAMAEEKIMLATKDADAKAVGSVRQAAKQSRDADIAVRNLLNNPKALAEKPWKLIEPLQRQETALLKIQEDAGELRKVFAADKSGDRLRALDTIPQALERNRALEAQARALMAPAKSERLAQVEHLLKNPASDRLGHIQNAMDVAQAPAAPRGFLEDMVGGSIMGHVAGAITGMPIIGPALGAKAGRFVSDLVFGRLGKATGEIAGRTKSAVAAFTGAVKSSPMVPVLASRVLANVRYAPEGSVQHPEPVKGESALATAYKQRTAELKTQTAYDAMGVPRMRTDARLAMADQFKALRALDTIGADQIEAIAVARVEYLAGIMPRRPDIGGIPVGKDHWQPSDLEMRSFARSCAAVEDPGAVEMRVAHGTVTPEDAKAYKAVYPARFQHYVQSVLGELPTLRTNLPYDRKLSLSIFTGVPVDPALDPRIFKVLQGQFDEPNTDNGSSQVKAEPQFGSVTKSVEKPTPAQTRTG